MPEKEGGFIIQRCAFCGKDIDEVGASGTGKTLFASTIARMLDVPFAILDTTSMTPAGYVGNDAEICLQGLLEKADGDASLAEKGIIYIDEIDKLAGTPDTNSGFFKENTQASLLKMVGGCEVPVPINGKTKYPDAKAVTLNTKNILFICGGAFPSLTGPDASQNQPIGFQQGTGETPDTSQTTGITHESLIEYGMMQELAGRLPVIVTLNALQENDLVRILSEPEDAITKEYGLLFEKDNVPPTFEEDALREIAGMALAKGTGARELRAILEDVLLQIMYDLPGQDISECIITKECIQTKIPTLVIGMIVITGECSFALSFDTIKTDLAPACNLPSAFSPSSAQNMSPFLQHILCIPPLLKNYLHIQNGLFAKRKFPEKNSHNIF